MAAQNQKVIGFYLPNGEYRQLKPGQRPYFLYESVQYPVTPSNYRQSSQYQSILVEGNQPPWPLQQGTVFYVGEESSGNEPSNAPQFQQDMRHSQNLGPKGYEYPPASLMVAGQYADYSTQVTGQWSHTESQAYPTNMTQPPIRQYSPQQVLGHYPAQQLAQHYTPQQPVGHYLPQPAIKQPMRESTCESHRESPAQTSPHLCINVPPPIYASPLSSKPGIITKPPSPTPPVKEVQCKLCRVSTFKHVTIRRGIYCLNCALEHLKNQEEWVKVENQAPWSAKELVDIYKMLSRMLDDSAKQQLPRDIPLPLDSYICIGRDEAVSPGYPAHGHIIGKRAVVVEDGCPNGHVLCQSCANKLSSCPEPNCGAFVQYQERPLGCPAHPGDEQHCAYFNKACNTEGCTGGMWPKKQPEGTNPSQTMHKGPEIAEGDTADAALLDQAAKKELYGKKGTTHEKQTTLKRHCLTRPKGKLSDIPNK